MGLETVHPDLAAEQAYVDRAYGYVALMLRDANAATFQGGEVSRDTDDYGRIFEFESFQQWKAARVRALSDDKAALVFGRIDTVEAETWYVGRHHVRDEHYDPVVIDWRAPVAEAFYQASATDPRGLVRRRQFLADGGTILGIADDGLQDRGATTAPRDIPPDPTVRGAEILQADLRRRRAGDMRDIVATIQAEQDAIIRAPLERPVVVQGGPGTGKTAIGLHRAAYLLYAYRDKLERRGVLVVGPNPIFIGYVSQVLPSLGEWAVTQVHVEGLAPFRTPAKRDPVDVARVKGDARMAEVLQRALDARWGDVHKDLVFSHYGVKFGIDVATIRDNAERLRSRRPAFRDGRQLLRDDLLAAAWRSYVQASSHLTHVATYRDIGKLVRNDAAFKRTVDVLWPSMSPEKLVGDLLKDRHRLAYACDGVLEPEQESLLYRRAGGFTNEDLPLLDDARELVLGAPERYGHVVVDEAQDLSPMQLRMISRRTAGGSITVLGDLAQATGVFAHDDWDEVIAHLPQPQDVHLEELTLGYRVSGAIMDLAARILREAAPALKPTIAVRADRGEVTIVASSPEARAREVARLATTAAEHGAAAVIAPHDVLPELRVALERAGVEYGDAESRGLSEPVTLVDVVQCKGLEFDAVVLVEPEQIVDDGGLRLLFVAVTRAMRSLTIVHTADLPDVLQPGPAESVA